MNIFAIVNYFQSLESLADKVNWSFNLDLKLKIIIANINSNKT